MTDRAIIIISNACTFTGLIGLYLLWGHWVSFACLCVAFMAQSGYAGALQRTGDDRYLALQVIATIALPIIVLIGWFTK